MFNISFGEIFVFLVIALIILGPEKLPQTLRSVMIKYQSFRKTLNKIQQDFENELELVELKQLMDQELKKIKENEEKLKAQLAQMQQDIDHFHDDTPRVKSTPHQSSALTYIFVQDHHIQVPYHKDFFIQSHEVKQVA
ncbi:Sec-independent protein translocase protein TatB [Acinetobacter puyangensis]|uniref:Sec-independent protein translocase protein TatB n=1 Tax=Acinetobacter puyangensis TaxID=1096779 RepID=UPI003A4D74FD